jgi:hypothetical protein
MPKKFSWLGFWGYEIRLCESADILQVSTNAVSLISNGYHNNLKMFLSCVILPVSAPNTTTIFIQISYFSGVRSSKSYI